MIEPLEQTKTRDLRPDPRAQDVAEQDAELTPAEAGTDIGRPEVTAEKLGSLVKRPLLTLNAEALGDLLHALDHDVEDCEGSPGPLASRTW